MVNAVIRLVVRSIGVAVGVGCVWLVYLGAPFPAAIIGVGLILLSTGAMTRIAEAFDE